MELYQLRLFFLVIHMVFNSINFVINMAREPAIDASVFGNDLDFQYWFCIKKCKMATNEI